MKYIFNKAVILFGVMLVSLNVLADTKLPARVEVYKPAAVLQRLVFESDVENLLKSGDWGQNKSPREKKHWVAFSDRDKNTTYASANTSNPIGELKFNESVIIAKIENGFALVYQDPKFTTWPGYSEKAVSKGWVPMDKLLLWESCPADDKGIYQKALLAANLEKKGNESMGYRYTNPQLHTDPKGIKTDMTFYYVLKTDPKTGMKLLANQARLDGNTDQVLYGWVDVNSFVPWNQRSCLEPNWKPNDVAYFNSPEGKPYPIYPDPQMKNAPATSYRYGVKNKEEKETSSTRYRMRAYDTRFPILDLDKDIDNSNLYRITTFGIAGRPVINIENDEVPDAKEQLTKTIDKLKNVNIIFVIDGTKSMKPYFASVKEAIKKGLSYFKPEKFTLRVGVVIYRDYTDGEFLTEKVALTKPNNPTLLSFLDSAGKYGAKSAPNDYTIAEALYKGLEVATDPSAMGFNKDQSTIIVVVGDCGNDPNDTKCLTSEQIVDRLANNNIQLISFQVESNVSLAYKLFNEQLRNIIKGNITKQYHKLNPNVNVKFKAVRNGYDVKTNAKVDFFIGSIRRPSEEIEIVNPGNLTTLIDENINQFVERVQDQINALVNSEHTGFAQNEDASGVDISEEFIKLRVGEKVFENLKRAGATLTFTGYAPKRDSQNREYWKAVAFMSSEEFEVLLDRLANVYNNARAEGDRKPYVDAIKALIRVMVPDITEKDMDEMGIDEVMRLAAGLNEGSEAVKGRSLKEIQDPRAVPNDEYMTMINTFKTKYKGLRDGVKNKNYKYSFKTPNGQKFYWIPVEDLP